MAISPDRTLAAYSSVVSGRPEIYVRSFPNPGEPTLVSQAGGNVPFWAADGTTLFYLRTQGVDGTVFAARLQRDPVPVVLATDSLFTVRSIAEPVPGTGLHPDGDRFVFAQAIGLAEADTPARLILVENFFEELRQRMGGN